MDELKKAAKKLIEDFYSMASTDADVYISIVPFAKDVNIGTGQQERDLAALDRMGETDGFVQRLAGSW